MRMTAVSNTWTGWAIAYYQWDTGLRFSEIEQAVPISKVRMHVITALPLKWTLASLLIR